MQIIIIRGGGLGIGWEDYCFEIEKFIHSPSTPTFFHTGFFLVEPTRDDIGRRRSHNVTNSS